MKEIYVLIKNVDGKSDGLLFELNRSGVPEGTLVFGYVDWHRKAVYFTAPGGDDCVAYIGHTCVPVNPMTDSEILEGTIVHHKDNFNIHYVLTKVLAHTVTLKQVSRKLENRRKSVENKETLLREYFWVGRMPFEEYNSY